MTNPYETALDHMLLAREEDREWDCSCKPCGLMRCDWCDERVTPSEEHRYCSDTCALSSAGVI